VLAFWPAPGIRGCARSADLYAPGRLALRNAEDMKTSATFRLRGGRDLTAGAVTDYLGVTPSRSFEAGTPVGRRSTRLRESSGSLLHSAPSIEVGTELSQQIERLLTFLEPKTQSL
jgi:hypothetical protein